MTTVVRVVGGYHIAWALFDASWPKIFNWQKTLSRLDGFHRGLMYIISRCLVVLYAGVAYVCWFHAREVLGTSLGRMILGFIVVYWGTRAVMQVQFFGLAGRANRLDVSRRDLNFPSLGSNQLVMNGFLAVFLVQAALPAIPLLVTSGVPLVSP